MKNILITGGCGFIGSNFINYILKKYDDTYVINLDAMYYCASESNIDREIRESDLYKNRYKLIKGNLCSYDLVNHIQHRIRHTLCGTKSRAKFFRGCIAVYKRQHSWNA